jgi:RNase P subunit RPR2
MASTATKARLKHLDHASHLLHSSSPSTSAFLQAQYNKVADENDVVVPEERKRKICVSCGAILIPGITARASTVKKCSKRLNSVGKLKHKTAFIECQKCNARIEYTVEPAAPKKLKATRKDSLAPKTSANVSSDLHLAGKQLAERGKKRARQRKSSSLQALLARSKAEATGSTNMGFALDLKDLLKSS